MSYGVVNAISYFHDHAQCVIPTLLAGHRFYKYHAFRAKTFFFFFQGLFIIVQSVYFSLFCQGHKIP